MAPPVSFATTTLPYPIFAADFDPYNRGYLVVGGGGGESRSGVPNQISVLDVSNRASISTVADIELSRDEDSVQSLGSLATRDGLITLAGINSSQAKQDAGQNQHFRSFDVKIPPRKRQKTEDAGGEVKGQITPIGQRSIFKTSPAVKKEKYQRILRLSHAQRREAGSKRIGAIASGLSKPSEIVTFDATTATPSNDDILSRIEPPNDAEVLDLDIAVADQDVFSLTWCTDYDIFEQTMDYNFETKKVRKTPKGPRRIHQMPFPDAQESPASRPKFRSVRFLDSQNIIALVNKPNKQGTELRIFHLYPTGPASTVLQKNLPSHVKQAVSLDVCILDSDAQENRQIGVAVAGQDISIETYTLDYRGESATFSRFQSFHTFKNVHKHQMTKLCFSPFHSPVRAPDSEEGKVGGKNEKATQSVDVPQHPGPQYVRLASVSYGNTVVVDTFALSPIAPKDKHSRYVLVHPQDASRRRYIIIALVSFMVLVMAFLLQSYLTAAPGGGPPRLLPPGYREFASKPVSAASVLETQVESSVSAFVESSIPSSVPGKQRLQELLSSHGESNKAVVVRDDPAGTEVSVDVHPDREEYLKQNTEAKHWDELHDEQKSRWKQRLIQAGRWTEHEGEVVLKGLLWSEYAGLVGQAAREVLREL